MGLSVTPATQPCTWLTLTMFMNYKGYGWSEKYPMAIAFGGATSVPLPGDVLTNAADGCARRAMLFGLGVTMVWARLTNTFYPKGSVAVISGPLPAVALTAESPIEKVNEVNDALFFRFEGLSGIHRNLMLRGLRDSWITDEDVTSSLVPTTPISFVSSTYLGGAMPGPYTMANALGNFLTWVGMNTVVIRKQTPTTGFYNAFYNGFYRNVSSRQTGRPFGLHRGKARSKV